MSSRKLKVWKGRAVNVVSESDPNWEGKDPSCAYAYICAHTRVDAQRLIEEYIKKPSVAHEVRNFFSEEWGFKMKGVEKERGIWIDFNRHSQESRPVRVH
ncbi:hypothetical protein ACI2KR_09255 [Pseudomonas luteola]